MEPIAIIGMAGRFPGAAGVHELWANVRAGVESIACLSPEQLQRSGTTPEAAADPSYVPRKGTLKDADLFDAALFGMSAREAELLDPQHRLFMECSVEALDAAGCDPARYMGKIGVWAGCGANSYGWRHAHRNRQILRTAGEFQIQIANDKDFLATRVAYKLNLRGPAITVQTACSTSLMAVAMAARSLTAGDCDMALAGGAAVSLPLETGYLFQPGMILSPDGHCRAFDAEAKGTVPANAVGIVVLRRLEDAKRDGDRILAVLLGVGFNNDGSAKVGFTAPSCAGQADAIARALADAQVFPESVTYIEAHGTGTELGDPIEMSALTEAYRNSASPRRSCAIGSIKTNMGHADAAAGVTGLIKTVQSLVHRELAPSLHFKTPNPHIDFDSGPFFVNTSLRPWNSEQPRRAGVSSFGVGGTNVHVIVEEAPEGPAVTPGRGVELLLLSAASDLSLNRAGENLAKYFAEAHECCLADVAHTLQTGRREFAYRRFLVASDASSAAAELGLNSPQTQVPAERGVVFLFPGQGSQYPGMARDLYLAEPFFRNVVDGCCAQVRALAGIDLLAAIYPENCDPEAAADVLREWAQPALFVIEYALARLFMNWGILPNALIGHSIGEYAAACIAGVFTLEDALRLVCERNRLVLSTAPGAMLAIPLPEAEVRELLIPGLSISAVNGPTLTVVSGSPGAVEEVRVRLAEDGIDCRLLQVARAMHSELMDPILETFEAAVCVAHRGAPRIPIVSSATGAWLTAEEVQDPSYWARHLREAVQFDGGLRVIFGRPQWTLLELGPGDTLTTLAKRHPQHSSGQPLHSAMRRSHDERNDVAVVLSALGSLWLRGFPIDWEAFRTGEVRRKVGLPGYAFDRQRYWIEPDPEVPVIEAPEKDAEPVKSTRSSDPADWFYKPVWKPEPRREAAHDERAEFTWLVFADGNELSARVVAGLGDARVVVVRDGDSFEQRGDGSFTVDSWAPESYRDLFDSLSDSGLLPNRIVHLWSAAPVDETEGPRVRLASLDQTESQGFYSLFHIAQAIGTLDRTLKARITVVTRGIFEVAGSVTVAPERSTVLGPARVIPQEYPDLSCVLLDLAEEDESGAEAVLSESMLPMDGSYRCVAWRQGEIWSRDFERCRLEPPAEQPATRLREKGVYIITGGFGGIGLTLADWLARTLQARLVLLGRSAVGSAQAQAIRELEAHGAEVLPLCADIASLTETEAAVQIAVKRFGAIHGVIHAAGLPAGGGIQRKTRAEAARILEAKVRGTLVLAAALEEQQPDFIILCSSLTALIGGFGQVDYCAANCFLDAWAGSRAGVQSIAWDGWQQVGMAARATAKPLHVLLSERRDQADGRVEFHGELDSNRHWVIGEHRVAGIPTLVGTAYIEMARAAASILFGGRPVVISDLILTRPIAGESGAVATVTEAVMRGAEYEISVRSRHEGVWNTNMICRAAAIDGPAQRLELGSIRRRCPREISGAKYTESLQRPTKISSRWDSLLSISLGDGESLALFEAPAIVADELSDFGVHPALLDAAIDLFPADGASRLPWSWGRVAVFRPLPVRFYSYWRMVSAPHEAAWRADITLADEEGEVLVEVRDFCLKPVLEAVR